MTARFEVDLAALDANLASLRARVAPAELMLVVKDDAYSHGITQIVPRAVAGGTRWIGAFDVATARAVRDAAGRDPRVFVWMLPSPHDVAAAIDLDLDLGIGDAGLLEDVASLATEVRSRTGSAPVRVHLKIDTGLHRNGFRSEKWSEAVHRAHVLEQRGAIRVVGIWSHIAEASDADDDDARVRFDRAVDEAAHAGLAPEMLHLSASFASFARPEFRYDLVRVGAFNYGISPAGGPRAEDLGLRPVGTLIAPVVDVAEEVRLGVGALDGIPSTLDGRFAISTPDGHRTVSTVGSTYILAASWPSARTGDEVAIFGADAPFSATDLGEAIGTIGEEIVTRLSPRIPRRYVNGA